MRHDDHGMVFLILTLEVEIHEHEDDGTYDHYPYRQNHEQLSYTLRGEPLSSMDRCWVRHRAK